MEGKEQHCLVSHLGTMLSTEALGKVRLNQMVIWGTEQYPVQQRLN